MPTPAFFKNLIPGATSNLCEKFNKLAVGLTQGVADWVAEEYNEDGQSLTDAFVTKLCAANCGPGGTGSGGSTACVENANMPTPSGVSASDGSFSSKVRVVWNAVTPPIGSVSNYLVYRAPSTESNPVNAALIVTISGTTYSYDDTAAVAGTTYNYWVRATNGTDFSCFGGPDTGNAASSTATLPQITDLRATQGIKWPSAGLLRLVFSIPVGATSIDVYRNTTDDSGTATKIGADVTFNDTTGSDPTIASGVAINNSGGVSLVYFDLPPSPTTKYYYWVIAKQDAPPQTSPFSNSAVGWVDLGTGDTGAGSVLQFNLTTPVTVPVAKTKMRICLIAGGGAGAGANAYHAGGGGGAGDILLADVTVVPGETWTLTEYFQHNVSSGFGRPPVAEPHLTYYDYEGYSAKLTRNSDSKTILCGGGANGLFDNSGNGSGGLAPSSTGSGVDPAITTADLSILKGTAGENAGGARGGRGGYAFGSFTSPPANYLGGTFDGDSAANPGSGSGGSSIGGDFKGGTNQHPQGFYCFAD